MNRLIIGTKNELNTIYSVLPANDFWFFVKFGGKFFSAHLANSVSAYIFL